jgi:hypothetical protein
MGVSPGSNFRARNTDLRFSPDKLKAPASSGASLCRRLTHPKCPELNPVENIWQYMRDNWLSNRVFKSYDDIVDHCCYAWNTLVDRPWKIMSIGLRRWAHGF